MMKKRFWALFLAVMMVVSVLPTSAFAEGEDVAVFDDADDALDATGVSATKTIEYNEDEDTYTITLSVEGTTTDASYNSIAADIILVVDTSTSMDYAATYKDCGSTEYDSHDGWDPRRGPYQYWSCESCGQYYSTDPQGSACTKQVKDKNRLDVAKLAAADFVTGLLEYDGVQIGLYDFSGSNRTEVELADDEDALLEAIEALDMPRDWWGNLDGDGTDYELGLTGAAGLLPSDSERTQVIVFLSDGAPSWGEDGVDEAEALMEDGVTIFTVGIDVDDDNDAQDALEDISSSDDDGNKYFYAASTSGDSGSALSAVLAKIQTLIENLIHAGTDGEMTDIVNGDAFEIIDVDTDLAQDGDELFWEIGNITQDEKSVSFDIAFKDDAVLTPGKLYTNNDVSLTFESTVLEAPVELTKEAIGTPYINVYKVIYTGESVEEQVDFILTLDELDEDDIPEYEGVISTKEGHTFDGWEEDVSRDGYTITYTAQWEPNEYDLTINYVYADGSEAADAYEAEVAYGAEYSVESPVIEGYTASLEVVEGTMPAEDVEVTVTYTANTYDYTIEYYYDGVIDGTKTILGTGEYGSKIETYEDKCIENYKFVEVKGLPMTITEIATNNRIQVYYVMKNTDVIVNKDVISVTSSSDQPAEAAEEEETKWTAKVGDTITWSIKVENKGNVEQTLTLEDILSNGEDVTVVDADGNAVTTFTLAEGKSVEFTATYVVKAEDKGKELVNTAVIKDGDQKKDEDPAPSVVVDDPKVSITKTADKTAVKVGDKVTYTIVVENKGNVELTGVKVTDTFVAGGKGKLTVKSGSLEIGTLAVGETATIVLEYTTVADDVKGLKNQAEVDANEVQDKADTEEVKVTKKNDPVKPVGPSKPQLNKADHYAYIVGYPDGLVHPEKNITRAEVATIFFRMLLDESREDFWAQENWFFDVMPTDWFNNAVSTLANANLINGYPDGNYRPNANITRAEFATIAIRFFLEEDVEITENNLSDVKGHWAEANIDLAYALNLINGYPDGTFRPDQQITRAEAMTIVNRVLERAPHKDHLLDDMIEWPDNMDEDIWYYADVQEATNSHEFYKTKDKDEDKAHEIWTELLPVRDWVALEQAWSAANSSKNPGEVVDIKINTP